MDPDRPGGYPVGVLRITGGEWRGRKLATPPGEDTRPALDAARLNLFNVIGPDLGGSRVLDVFAGSGAFGLESLSRGASRAVLVELAGPALRTIRDNVAALRVGADRCEILAADAYALADAASLGGPFDIVFVAPPYPHFRSERARLGALVAALRGLLADDGLGILQSDAADAPGAESLAAAPGLAVAGRRKWGRTAFTFVRREDPPAVA